MISHYYNLHGLLRFRLKKTLVYGSEIIMVGLTTDVDGLLSCGKIAGFGRRLEISAQSNFGDLQHCGL